MTRLHRRQRALLLALVIGAAAASTFTVGGAGATPLSDQQAQAAALEAQINANAVKLDALNEQVRAAQYQLDQANATIADATTRIAAAKAQADRLQAMVEQRAVAIYQRAANGADSGLFNVDPTELASSQKYTAAASGQDNTLVDQLKEARTILGSRERDAEHAKAAAESQKAQVQAAESSFQATNSQYQGLLSQVKGTIATLVAQDQAARVAQQAPHGGGGNGGGGPAFDPSKVPPASGRGGVAVSFAAQQLGKPYCYAGAGPSCYDCSGLTMAAWGAAGVGLPHNSEAQAGMLPHVPLGAMAAGDIAYTSGHVGIYVGGGAVIHAPHTGDVVRYIDAGYFAYGLRP
ncbi:MAG TPA: NlpC/P60 family protein [Acidimicrobiia bacterium]|jgi:cell wall-associated NlpC family hydrolase|nr:NlpC/P60 family protein [Acidimicrobiia bacterium]